MANAANCIICASTSFMGQTATCLILSWSVFSRHNAFSLLHYSPKGRAFFFFFFFVTGVITDLVHIDGTVWKLSEHWKSRHQAGVSSSAQAEIQSGPLDTCSGDRTVTLPWHYLLQDIYCTYLHYRQGSPRQYCTIKYKNNHKSESLCKRHLIVSFLYIITW